MAPHNPCGPLALAACAHVAAAIPNFLILEHCPIQPWFEQVQRVKVTVRQGHIDVRELAQRPGLGIEFDMDLVRSRSQHLPMQASRYTTIDGSTPFL